MLQKIELNQESFAALSKQGKIISSHSKYGPKVFTIEGGDYVKVFNPKSGLTKRHFFPKYKQFINNVNDLKRLSIATVDIKSIYHITQYDSYAVRYSPLQGQDLRSLAGEGNMQIVRDFLPFLVKLHASGVYFRGIHLGNILLLDDKTYGLIDVADLYVQEKQLSLWSRVRNLAHMVATKPDDKLFKTYTVSKFLDDYINSAEIQGYNILIFRAICRLYGLGDRHEK